MFRRESINNKTHFIWIELESLAFHFTLECKILYYSLTDFYWSFDWSMTVRLSVERQLWASIIMFKFGATPSLTILIYTFKQINPSNLQFFPGLWILNLRYLKLIQTISHCSLFIIIIIIDPCKMWIKFFLVWNYIENCPEANFPTSLLPSSFGRNSIWRFVQIS